MREQSELIYFLVMQMLESIPMSVALEYDAAMPYDWKVS